MLDANHTFCQTTEREIGPAKGKKNGCMRSQSLESSGDSFAAFSEHVISFLLMFFSAFSCLFLVSHFRWITLSFDSISIVNTSCYTKLEWNCYSKFPFGSAFNFHCTFHSLFSSRNRFVICFQGVQCDWVCLGRFSKNKPIKYPHSLQYLLSVWACMEVLQKLWLYLWFGFAANLNRVGWLLQNELGRAC